MKSIHEKEPKSSQEQLEEILQKFQPGIAQTQVTAPQKPQQRSSTIANEGIPLYQRNEARRPQQIGPSKTTSKKERPELAPRKISPNNS